jgi:hypothetical protein
MGGKFPPAGADGVAEAVFQKPMNRVMKLCDR